VKDSHLTLLGAEPSFVADVCVAAALIERGEYALYVLGGISGEVQPGTFGTVGFEVAGRVAFRHFWESTAFRSKAGKFLTGVDEVLVGTVRRVGGSARFRSRGLCPADADAIHFGNRPALGRCVPLIRWPEFGRRRAQITQLTHSPIIPANADMTRP
jgi:hypothetical protein